MAAFAGRSLHERQNHSTGEGLVTRLHNWEKLRNSKTERLKVTMEQEKMISCTFTPTKFSRNTEKSIHKKPAKTPTEKAAMNHHMDRLSRARKLDEQKKRVPHATGKKWTRQSTTAVAPPLSYQKKTKLSRQGSVEKQKSHSNAMANIAKIKSRGAPAAVRSLVNRKTRTSASTNGDCNSYASIYGKRGSSCTHSDDDASSANSCDTEDWGTAQDTLHQKNLPAYARDPTRGFNESRYLTPEERYKLKEGLAHISSIAFDPSSSYPKHHEAGQYQGLQGSTYANELAPPHPHPMAMVPITKNKKKHYDGHHEAVASSSATLQMPHDSIIMPVSLPPPPTQVCENVPSYSVPEFSVNIRESGATSYARPSTLSQQLPAPPNNTDPSTLRNPLEDRPVETQFNWQIMQRKTKFLSNLEKDKADRLEEKLKEMERENMRILGVQPTVVSNKKERTKSEKKSLNNHYRRMSNVAEIKITGKTKIGNTMGQASRRL